MAVEMHNMFSRNRDTDAEPLSWDPSTMRIRCFCHKLQLIINAGLAQLGVKTAPSRRVKKALLGQFPDFQPMPTISEVEDEEPIELPLGQIS